MRYASLRTGIRDTSVVNKSLFASLKSILPCAKRQPNRLRDKPLLKLSPITLMPKSQLVQLHTFTITDPFALKPFGCHQGSFFRPTALWMLHYKARTPRAGNEIAGPLVPKVCLWNRFG